MSVSSSFTRSSRSWQRRLKRSFSSVSILHVGGNVSFQKAKPLKMQSYVPTIIFCILQPNKLAHSRTISAMLSLKIRPRVHPHTTKLEFSFDPKSDPTVPQFPAISHLFFSTSCSLHSVRFLFFSTRLSTTSVLWLWLWWTEIEFSGLLSSELDARRRRRWHSRSDSERRSFKTLKKKWRNLN